MFPYLPLSAGVLMLVEERVIFLYAFHYKKTTMKQYSSKNRKEGKHLQIKRNAVVLILNEVTDIIYQLVPKPYCDILACYMPKAIQHNSLG